VTCLHVAPVRAVFVMFVLGRPGRGKGLFTGFLGFGLVLLVSQKLQNLSDLSL